jgi:hypothetical protein
MNLLERPTEWVARRVETVSLANATMATRRVSVDFTPSHGVPANLSASQTGEDYVPLALLKKERLLNFSLRDESDEPKPLLARSHNSLIATAALTVLAEARVGHRVTGTHMPPELIAEFYDLAHADEDVAREIWRQLPRGPGGRSGDHVAEWRAAIASDASVMTLARDLADAFLVLVDVPSLDRRRIMKYAYEERVERPERGFAAAVRAPWATARQHMSETVRWATRDADRRPSGALGSGRLNLSVEELERGPDEHPWNPPGERPRLDPSEVTFVLRDDSEEEQRFAADANGRATVQMPVGTYDVTVETPDWVVVQPTSAHTVKIEEGATHHAPFQLLFLTAGSLVDIDAGLLERRLTFRTWLLRGMGWRAKRINFSVQATGQAAAAHFEFEAPDDLQATHARLVAPASYLFLKPTPEDHPWRHVNNDTAQRTHVFLEDVPPRLGGAATVRLRPRSAVVIAPASIAAFLTAVLLAAIAFRQTQASHGLPQALSLLLLLPGGFAAYAARPREHAYTTRALAGLRTMAITSILLTFAAGAVLVFGRNWTETKAGAFVPDPLPVGSQVVLYGLASCGVIMFAALVGAFRETRLAREQQP